MSDPYSAPLEEAHIPDYELDDLPLDIIEIEEETLQTGQISEYQEFGEGEEWIAEALATVRVREAVMVAALGSEKRERIRTQRKKEAFIDHFMDTMCSISATCLKVDVSRQTYYDWMKSDPQFRSAVYAAEESLNDLVEDKLKMLVAKDDPASVRYYLDRRSEKYKPKGSIEHVVGNQTLEELLWAAAARKQQAEQITKAEVISITTPDGNNNGEPTRAIEGIASQERSSVSA